ncbi:MAG: M36 family metallopeptidase, partial [Myxococcota bacterium]
SEGWADFIGLYMSHLESDAGAGAYPVGVYATDDPYFGIRRYPYSTDFGINDLSFRHIQNGEPLPGGAPFIPSGDNNQVHNAGEIWATMMWGAYQALLDRSRGNDAAYSYAEARRRMADYIVMGMMLTPESATYTESKDAIVAAATAVDIEDGRAVAEAFARRGAGSCAVSPPRYVTDLVGVVEDFDVVPISDLGRATVDDTIDPCDGDGVLDAGEVGVLNVVVENSGLVDLTTASLVVTTDTPGVTIVDAMPVAVPSVGAVGTTTIPISISVDDTVTDIQTLEFALRLTSPESCVTEVDANVAVAMNFDETRASSASDTVETSVTAWTAEGPLAGQVWSRESVSSLDHRYRAEVEDTTTDTAFVSPVLEVSTTDRFAVILQHAYSFVPPDVAGSDAGVIEISRDGGTVWEDVIDYASFSYPGALASDAGTALAGRPAFVGESTGFPALESVVLDFDDRLAGETLLFRFRLATGPANGLDIWLIDDIQFFGLDNTPFPSREVDDGVCQEPPVAVVEPGGTLFPGDTGTLDASASSDANDDPLTFAWTQTSG